MSGVLEVRVQWSVAEVPASCELSRNMEDSLVQPIVDSVSVVRLTVLSVRNVRGDETAHNGGK